MSDLLEVMAKLRDPDGGCPWDLEQDYRSIVPHTLEEAYEVADAIERDDFVSLQDELGDLLFQVLFYAQLASEEKRFSFDDVVVGLRDKLVRRHPHVFADAVVQEKADVHAAWEQVKEQERQGKAEADGRAASVLDDVPVGLPALSRAAKLQKRASRVGFDWNDISGPLAKVHEETAELEQCIEMREGGDDNKAIEHELGDLLFSVVNVARFRDIDPERALRHANARFSNRFGWIEQAVVDNGGSVQEAGLDELDALWVKAKRALDDSAV